MGARKKSPPNLDPKFVTIDDWLVISGMGKSSVYQELARGNLIARKVGARSLIDVAHGLRWLRSRPLANVVLANSRRKTGKARPSPNPRARREVDAAPAA